MESDSDQSDSKLQFSFKPEPQHQQQTVTSIQIHLPLCINTTCDKPNKCKTMAMSSSDPAENNNNSNLASSSSSAHTNQSTAHESQTSGSSQNVCAYCGQESAEIRPAPSTPYSSTAASSSSSLLLMGLPSQEAAKVRKREAAAELLTLPREDDAAEWIFCDLCHKWFHSICVDVQQYELSLIEKFHCPGCQIHNGPSKMKVKRLLHRYAFDDESQRELPVQIGTETWIRQFKEDYMKKIPEATAAEMIRVYKDGTELSHKFNFTQNWTEPIKVLNSRGLGLRMPEDEFFDVVDVIKLLGSHVLVDTIDVYAQQSYTMSLNRFYDFWRKRNRDRLYNVLSLEFSETKLAEIIRSPSLVRELSWAQRFWPNNEQQTEDMANLKTIKPDLDIYSFMENTTYHRYAIPAHELEQQEESSRPYVEHFCLMGMKDSYTDFHIDFGGSSVWYHVFRGEKVFFIAPPSAQNLAAFLGWQKNKQRAEIFFGELLPPGQKLYRLHVRERETLFLPSGWIHSVYTPKDSIVFGGNFLHNLNVPMQLKVFQLEADAETEERFKFPFFELCNFYAGKSISESLKDLTAEGELADQVLLDAATALHTKCAEWLQLQPEKFAIFNGTLKLMERELSRQQCLQRRIGGKTVKGSGSGGHSTPIPDPMAGMPKLEPEPPSATTSQRVCQFEVRRDLDSSWEEFEEDEDHSESADDEAQQQSTHGQRATSSSNRGHRLRKYVLKPRGISREGSADSPATAVVEFESQGPVRLKIKLPCWRRSSEQQHPADVQTKRAKYANKKQMMAEPESEANLDVGAMFTGKSAHGRQLRPTARITDIVDGPEHAKATDLFTETFSSDAHQNHPGKKKDSDFLTAVRAGSSSNSTRCGNKSFMAQFSAEEKRQIELADKAAEREARGELFTTPPPKIRATAKKRKLQTVGQKLNANAGGNETVAGGDNNVPTTSTQKLPKAQKDTAVEKKPKKVGPLGSRERLAKKLGLNRKK